MKKLQLCLFFTLVTFSHASMGAYTAVGDYGGFPHGGYTDTRVNANTVIVRYDGNLVTTSREVQNYMLYRSARVTIDNGYDYFIVVSNSGCRMNTGVKTATTYEGHTTNPPVMHRTYSKRIYYEDSYEIPTRTSSHYQAYNPNSCDSRARSATSVIKMFNGAVPDVPNAYNAYDVIAHLGPATWSPFTF